ncbi:MAG: hypothetical protein H0T73_19885 [Ardenticatenales bacterium]|nr:hypothetical protein [Ardenticatenales bacterium]
MAASSPGERAPNENALLECGADGIHEGSVIGCCHVCGLLLCRAHLFHQTRGTEFGEVEHRKAYPITCGEHAGYWSRKGMPTAVSAAERRQGRRFNLFRRKAKGTAAQRQKRRG